MSQANAYDCREAFQRLEDYVDRELAADELARVEEHLRICEMCAHEFAFEARVLGEIRARLHRIEVPERVREGLARLLEGERRGESG